MQKFLEPILNGERLSKDSAAAAMRELAGGSVPHAQIAAFLTAFKVREVTAAELSGFRAALLELAIPLKTETDVIDLCGTGGDGKNTFNISTTAAFVVAASGVPVAKHGNYGISSACGSSNVLEFLKVPFAKDADHARRQLAGANIAFLHAPNWHPAMKAVAPVRKELGFKTIFNMLGPLVNPARPRFQLIGVHSARLRTLYAEILESEPVEFGVLHSADGYDEISLTGSTQLSTRHGHSEVRSGNFGAQPLSPEELESGPAVSDYAKTLHQILEGRGTPAQNSVVAANAAAALSLSRPNSSLAELYGEALEIIRSGKAAKTLATVREIV